VGHDAPATTSTEGVWAAKSEWLCPLIADAALSDRAAEIAAGRRLEFGTTAFPLWLAPYADCGAPRRNAAIELSWRGVTLIISPDEGLAIEGDMAAIAARTADTVRCGPAGKDTVTALAGAPGH